MRLSNLSGIEGRLHEVLSWLRSECRPFVFQGKTARTWPCRSYFRTVKTRLSGYSSLGRIVLIPAYRDDRFGPAIDDPERLVTCLVSSPAADLGAIVIRLLGDQRPRDFELNFRGEAHRQRLAVRRRLLCKAFGVRAAKDWLAGCTHVRIMAAEGEVTVRPLRRDGKQDAWSGKQGDPVETALVSDSVAVGSAVQHVLAMKLPPLR